MRCFEPPFCSAICTGGFRFGKSRLQDFWFKTMCAGCIPAVKWSLRRRRRPLRRFHRILPARITSSSILCIRPFLIERFDSRAKDAQKAAAARCRKTQGELERAKALSNFNRAQRHVRWGGCLPERQASRFATGKAKSKISVCRRREDFCGGKSHFPEQKSFLCSFCARKSERFQQKLVGVAGRLKTRRVFRFCLWQNCHGSNRRFEARHLAGELAPPSTSLSKIFLTS